MSDISATTVASDQQANQQQWIRKIGLFVSAGGSSALDLSNMRIVFRVFQADLPSTPNYATIKVYNLSDDTATSVQK